MNPYLYVIIGVMSGNMFETVYHVYTFLLLLEKQTGVSGYFFFFFLYWFACSDPLLITDSETKVKLELVKCKVKEEILPLADAIEVLTSNK